MPDFIASIRQVMGMSAAFSAYVRRHPLSYALLSGLATSMLVFASSSFTELSQDSAWLLMTTTGVAAATAVLGAATPFGRTGSRTGRLREQAAGQNISRVMESLDDGLFLFDAEERLITCNDIARQIFPEVTQRQASGGLMDLGDLANMIAAHNGRSESGLIGLDLAGAALHLLRKQGAAEMLSIRGAEWYRVTARQTEDGSHLIVFSDMTEFVDRGLKLKESEARFERLAEHLPGAILRRQERANGSFTFDYWNGGIRDLTGLEPDHFVGDLENLLKQVHADDREEVRQRFEQGDRSQASWSMEFRILHARRSAKWVSLTMRARLNRIGRAVFEGILLDITERKQVEQTIRRAHEEAEKGSQAKTNFLANMSHELRTPLNAVIGFSEMMMHQTLGPLNPPKYREYAGDIRGAAVHLLDLISDILDLSRHEAGQFELRETTLDANELLKECERFFSTRAQQRGMAFQVRLSAEPVKLRVDHLRIRQIMLNLISNAMKFTDDGGSILIEVRLDPSGPQLRVQDTGIGMDKPQIAKAFEPFGRVESQLTSGREGTGLGLPLSAVLAEHHDGELLLESEPGRGTLAILQLPDHRLLRKRQRGMRECA